MRMPSTTLVLIVLASLAAGTQAPTSNGPLAAEPGISPDGREVAFVSGGDIWSMPIDGGGDARLLVSHPATESRPMYSPANDALAFVSTRTGGGDIYVLRFGTATLTRLTYDDGAEMLDGWSRDGQWVYFSSTTRDIAGMNDVFRVRAAGGTPMPVTRERYTNEFAGAPSADGRLLAFSARGIASSQWWRNGHSHIDESEIWLRSGLEAPDAAPRYQQVVGRDGKALWPMWGGDAQTLFFVSDRGGAENIWRVAIGGQPERVTAFEAGRVLWPSITADGRTVAFERGFGVWTLDTADGRAAAVPIRLRGAPAAPGVERQRLTSQFSDLALSPDGKKIAFVARGDVFAASAKDGGDAERVTATPGREQDVRWLPDSRTIVYVTDRDGARRLASYDFGSRTETVLTGEGADDLAPVVSPDGTHVAFLRGGRELRVIERATRRERVLASGDLPSAIDADRPVVWSRDGRWVAYMVRGTRGFTNARLVPADGGESRPVSFLANFSADSLAWAPDGTYLTFATGQRTEPGQVARVDLVLRTPKFREDQFRSLFEQETPRPPAQPEPRSQPSRTEDVERRAPSEVEGPDPVDIVFDDIRRRLSLLPVGVDVFDQQISPDGKWLLMTASAAGQTNLYLYPLDELSREPAVTRQLTTTAGSKGNPQFTADSKEIYYLDDGRIQIATVEDRRSRALSVTAELDVEFAAERTAVFEQAWSYMRDFFFDAAHNGVDWAAARREYAPRVDAARTPDEMRRVISLMIGELDASHLGISAPPGGGGPVTGRLGLRFSPGEYERHGRLRVEDVLPLGPAALTRSVAVGDYLIAVDGRRIDGGTNLDELLQHTVGKRVVLSVSASADGAAARDVAVRPASLGTEKGLLYRQWVEEQRARVASLSQGRLGYAHMPDMGAQSLQQLFVDLDAENHAAQGVVIDVRNNNGGFVNVYAIDVLARRSYFDMTLRGSVRAPSRSVLGQRALERPTVLVTNQHSLSDAEDFTEGYRALGLGTVVGEPTAGWIIYTWNTRLVDGSTFRLPRMRITDGRGQDMEMQPRPVDVAVTRDLGEGLSGRDSQIEAAVRELLARIDGRPTQQPR